MQLTGRVERETEADCPGAGSLHVVCGCMFAGKTEALLDQIEAWPAARRQVFKHVLDDRYDVARVVSHLGRSCAAIAIESADQLWSRLSEETAYLALDEGHFFDERLPDICRRLVARKTHVLITTLDRDCWYRPFPMIEVLRAMADEVTVKSARCGRCGFPASRTQRLTPIIDGRIVGGAESFEPRCDQCWSPPPGSSDQITRDASNTGPCVQHNS